MKIVINYDNIDQSSFFCLIYRSQMASMTIPRCEFGMCALDGYLYAFGGWVGEDIGGTIERYDPVKDQWEYLTKMQEPRFSMGICVYDSLIYLVGGCTHSRRHMQELVSYNPVSTLDYLRSAVTMK